MNQPKREASGISGLSKHFCRSELKIVPLENSYSKKTGDNLRPQVFFGGLTLQEKTVFADNRDGEQYSTQKLATDKDGKVTVKLDRKGVWLIRLIRLVYMQRCPKNCSGADGESLWAALTLGVK